METSILDRTKKVLSENLIEKIETITFCIVGCGAVGAAFAEMLVRTGAQNIILIDGDSVELTNLNRVTAFLLSDVDKKKVDILEERLKAINPNVNIKKASYHLKRLDPNSPPETQDTRNLVVNSGIVINVPDNNKSRITCQELCADFSIKTLSIGVRIKKDFSEYECVWNPKVLDQDRRDDEGYGDGSYIAIVAEATSVGFMMLLHHLENSESNDFVNYYKKYKNYLPLCCQ